MLFSHLAYWYGKLNDFQMLNQHFTPEHPPLAVCINDCLCVLLDLACKTSGRTLHLCSWQALVSSALPHSSLLTSVLLLLLYLILTRSGLDSPGWPRSSYLSPLSAGTVGECQSPHPAFVGFFLVLFLSVLIERGNANPVSWGSPFSSAFWKVMWIWIFPSAQGWEWSPGCQACSASRTPCLWICWIFFFR